MEKCRRIEAEFKLPKVIIQHIQSFLSGKEAAQTTILSKSWYSAWLTRPNLDFDQTCFRDGDDVFWEFVKTTIERYENLNLKIESFRLCFRSFNSLVRELILKAIKMGVADLDLESRPTCSWFELPREVLEFENLERLSVFRCKIDLGEDGKIRCSRLKSLSLCNVFLEGDILWNIISSCPLIEKLSLTGCELSNGGTQTSMLALSPYINFGKQNVGAVVDGPISPNVFHKLKCLLLWGVNVHTLFFQDFSTKFPCLKDLTVRNCKGFKGIRISSPSLECISFKQDRMLRVKFDVPRIRKFTFDGSSFPSLSFRAAKSNWKSNVSITSCYSPSASWFLKLNRLLTKLSGSQVSLLLRVLPSKTLGYAGNQQGLPKPMVGSLTIDVPYSVTRAFCESLFQWCRPLLITDYWNPKLSTQNDGSMKMVYESLRQSECAPCRCDLKEVNVEYFDGVVSKWRRAHSKSVFDAPGAGQRIRLRLKWG